jgi:hypothetical protein
MDFKKTFDSDRTEVLYNIVIEFGSPVKVIRLTKTCLIETCNRFRVGKLLSNTFRIENGLKQIDALSPLLFTYSLGDAFGSVHDGFGTDFNTSALDESIHIVKKDT